MTVYDRAAASALRMITKYGQDGTLRRTTTGAYDPETGTAPVTTTDYAVKVALFDYDLRASGAAENGGLIQVGDKQILMPASGLIITPAPGDLVVAGGATWRVMNVKSINPAGTPVMYEILGRM